MPIPRPIADIAALFRDLATSPREVLLVRHHHQWIGAGYITLLQLADALGWHTSPTARAVILAVGGSSWALDIAGTIAHVAWQRGRIWQDITCDCCDGPGGGWDDEAEDGPDAPDDHGLSVEDEAWLRSLGSSTCTPV